MQSNDNEKIKTLGSMHEYKLAELQKMADDYGLNYSSRATKAHLRTIVKAEWRRRKAEAKKTKDPKTADLHKRKIYKKFTKWCAKPDLDKCLMLKIEPNSNGRYPTPRLRDFADYYGIHITTLSVWRRRKDFQQLVDQYSSSWGLDLVPNVLAGLYRRAAGTGKADEVELFLNYFKGWSSKKTLEHKVERFDEGDLRTLISALPKDKQDQFYDTLIAILGSASLGGDSEEDA